MNRVSVVVSAFCALALALGGLSSAVPARAAAAASRASVRVVGGTGASTPRWMSQVWVQDLTGTGLCGGELVAGRWVLTAAHCAVSDVAGLPLGSSAFRVRIGTPGLAPPTSADPGTPVDGVRIDPAFRSGVTYGDVALLHLAAAPPITPVALGDAGAAVTGAVPAVLGWGVTASGTTSTSLQRVDQPILDPSACAGYGRDFVADSMICAGAVKGQDSCNGDSGGPLALGAEGPAALLLGTVDFGSDNCGDGTPAVYQRVTEGATAAWLRTVLARPQIAVSPATPAKGATVTLTASSPWPDATYAWDLDGNGTYGDAAGPVVRSAVTAARTVSVLAASAGAGDDATARATVSPLDPAVTVTGPSRVTEGRVLKLTLASAGGSGTVTAKAPGVATKRATIPGAGVLRLRVPHTAGWRAPRRLTVRLTASGTLRLAAATVTVTVVDADTPRLTAVRVAATGRGATARARVPGRGALRVTAVAGGRTLAARTVTTRSRRTVTTRLRLTAAQRARRPQIRLRWTSAQEPAAHATATRRLS
ncbi:serine protease [Paraconexibacter antarcticus]|uniref:Serine protease n=1 Tax=Paraconexibacter antarcticus TaxID=2949664 RepID=A0ABY5DWX7_9ACTN|nr:serine protease [Paraconexibacter antarcticus]UTI66049.1 serine protease [Paraconexibacter antarcticus]